MDADTNQSQNIAQPTVGGTAPAQPPKVLATLNADGSRRWLRPKLSPGSWWTRRRVVAYLLMAAFTITPYLRISGRPLFQFDVMNREFIFFGVTFFATETLLLALLLLSVFVGIFLITALFGRAWCGWACPQTVYMEFLYRPIERLAQGPFYKQGGGNTPAWRLALQYGLYLAVSLFLANTFLSWFVGTDRLLEWMRHSPIDHPQSFLLVAGVTGMMMIDFCFFREQMCTIACPYGRLQSVLLDPDSLIVGYDHRRGEPRGKKSGRGSAVLDAEPSAKPSTVALGDCVDCHLCVKTCPTGIDIREGLQMECIHCTQCMDACDQVMDKLGRERGLIRYGSQNGFEGRPVHRWRPRVVLYPILLLGLLSLLGWRVSIRQPLELTFLRVLGTPYAILEDGRVSSQVHLRLQNKGAEALEVDVALVGEGELIKPTFPMRLEPKADQETSLFVVQPRSAFVQGVAQAQFEILRAGSEPREVLLRAQKPLLGPAVALQKAPAPLPGSNSATPPPR